MCTSDLVCYLQCNILMGMTTRSRMDNLVVCDSSHVHAGVRQHLHLSTQLLVLIAHSCACTDSNFISLYTVVCVGCFIVLALASPMPVSPVQAAKRVFVALLVSLAATYRVAVRVTRDSPDVDVKRAYRLVAAKAHPDKGGSNSHIQRLNAARDNWLQARPTTANGSRAASSARPAAPRRKRTLRRPAAAVLPVRPAPAPPALGLGGADLAESLVAPGTPCRASFRIQGVSCLLTYQGLPKSALEQWKQFKVFIMAEKKGWSVRHWCATLETNDSGKGHLHLMLEFTKPVDCTTARFVFRGIRPNVSTTDYLGEGFCRKKMEVSIRRAMFYVWADKIGTQRDASGELCVAGNIFPSWVPGPCTKYPVPGRWPDNLWKAHKLSHGVYEQYVYLCRDGVVSRINNLNAVRTQEEEVAQAAVIEANVERIRSNPKLYQPYPPIPEAVSWLAKFQKDATRYPLLIVLGPSFSGKTEWVQSLFRNAHTIEIGTLTHFPLTMKEFDRSVHDGLILDDIRDLAFISSHQEKLQSSVKKAVEFASTAGGTCAYKKYLFQIPTAVTINHTTLNLNYLWTNDWLMRDSNRILVEWPAALHRVQGGGA